MTSPYSRGKQARVLGLVLTLVGSILLGSAIPARALNSPGTPCVPVPCNTTLPFNNLNPAPALSFRISNTGDCPASFTAYQNPGQTPPVLVDVLINPGQSVEINRPHLNASSIVLQGFSGGTQANLGFAPLVDDESPNAAYWERNGDHTLSAGLGNVGIGTSNPSDKLTVNGNVNLDNVIFTRDVPGVTWQTQVLDPNGNGGTYTSIDTIGESNIYVGYYEATSQEVRAVVSTDGGTNWSYSVVEGSVANNPNTAIDALTTQDVYMVYVEDASNEVRFAASNDGGLSWMSSVVVASNSNSNGNAIVALNANDIVVAYRSNSQVMVSRSTNGGASFSPGTIIAPVSSGMPTLAQVDPQTIAMSYYDNSGETIKFSLSTNSGVTWSLPTTVGTQARDGSSLTIGDGQAYFVAYRTLLGTVRVAKSLDMGQSWPTTVDIEALQAGTLGQHTTSISSLDSANVCLAYVDSANEQLKFTRSIDGGLTWTPVVVTRATGTPYIALSKAGALKNFIVYREDFAMKFASDALNRHVGIGVSNPSNVLTLPQGSQTDPIADAWTTYSSRRFKSNIRPLSEALDKILALDGVRFDWRGSNRPSIGLIAEEVGKVFPELVVYEENRRDARSLDYSKLVAVLIEGMKEQQSQIEKLEEKLDHLTRVGTQGEDDAGEFRASRKRKKTTR